MSDQGASPCRERRARNVCIRARAAAWLVGLGLVAAVLSLAARPASAVPVSSMSDLLGPSPLARLLGGGQPRGALRTAVTGSIAPGGPPVAAAFAAGDNVRLAFTAAAGQRVSVLATNVSMTGYQYGCCLGSLSIVNSAGQQ